MPLLIILNQEEFDAFVYLWSVVRFVELSWLAGPLLYAVVLARVPLNERRILGRLRSVGDTELHDHYPGPWRSHS